ncbi:serine hydrolase domain-containing protein [Flavisphingomonas formosensis]|uniref:serine hydrolase domain-containing protein n=1 Tax=Flavisphingomonas formosensis TaxID=861534 RepID=UPI0012F71E6F|nr:serine hydrolase domain-containing protein [Sphingomonas formosensis]
MHRKRSLLTVGVLMIAGLAGLGCATMRSGEAKVAGFAFPLSPAQRLVPQGGTWPKDGKGIDYARLDERLQRLVGQGDMTGLAVGIVQNGELSFVKGYGETDRVHGQPVTENTVFRWASLSKGVAATLIAKLADEKKLSLNDPIARWAPSLHLPRQAEQRATVLELLSQRLGIARNAYDGELEGGADPRIIRAKLASLDLLCQPGQCFSYQNVAFDAAGEIAERATGKRYADLVEQQLFRPLGMMSASLTRQGLESAPSWARPTRGGHSFAVNDAYYRIPAAGGVNSSIVDLALWMRAQMGEADQIIPQRVLDTVHSPHIATRRMTNYDRAMTDASYALGWRDYNYDGHRLIGHRGAVNGYRSLILFDPALKTGVVALWNSESNRPVGLQLEMFDMLYHRPAHDWLQIDSRIGGGIRRTR